jgi:hypothetical protein
MINSILGEIIITKANPVIYKSLTHIIKAHKLQIQLYHKYDQISESRKKFQEKLDKNIFSVFSNDYVNYKKEIEILENKIKILDQKYNNNMELYKKYIDNYTCN